MRYIIVALCLALGLLAMAAEQAPVKVAPPTLVQSMETQKQGRYLATITLANGRVIEVVLEGAYAPYTVTNFVNLANAKFYDGLTFHRVEPGFVIQGGDPKANGSGGPGYKINLELSPFLRHKKGVISMARTNDPDTAGSQFFITLGDVPFLDGRYAAFGWVKSGMDAVDKVQIGDGIKSITVKPYDGKEPVPILADSVK